MKSGSLYQSRSIYITLLWYKLQQLKKQKNLFTFSTLVYFKGSGWAYDVISAWWSSFPFTEAYCKAESLQTCSLTLNQATYLL